MRTSLIINTASLDARVNAGRNPWRSAGYQSRYRLLKDRVLPAALTQGFDEIFVCGAFEAGDGYEYIPVEPRYRDRRDALWQREMGGRYATGDVLVWLHDDHLVADNFVDVLRTEYLSNDSWDLLIPKRLHGITGQELNNGKSDNYMGGHCLVMRRGLWARCPWTMLDTIFWDTSMTRVWREAGGRLIWSDSLIHIDVEAAENET